jgi:hypothetical protein
VVEAVGLAVLAVAPFVERVMGVQFALRINEEAAGV